MKRILTAALALVLMTSLVLTGCGHKPMFHVSQNEDNTVSVTAEKASEGSSGISHLSVGENDEVVVDASLEGEGMIRIRMMTGMLGSEDFSDEPVCESTISGSDSMRFTIEPGEYTIGVVCMNQVTGTAIIKTEARAVTEGAEPAEESAAEPEPETEPAAGSIGEKRVSDEQAILAIKNYCFLHNPDLESVVDAEEYPVYWDISSSDEDEIVVLFRSYTGAQIRYYIDPVSGETYVMEFVPGASPEEEQTEEAFNVWDYIS